MVLITLSFDVEIMPFCVTLGISAEISGSDELILLFLEIKVFFRDSSSNDWSLVEGSVMGFSVGLEN
jgi:hypothetical protein